LIWAGFLDEGDEDVDFIGWKTGVNNLRTKVNMLYSKFTTRFHKTDAPTKSVCGVSMFRANQVWYR
jgi:hypothetical protein